MKKKRISESELEDSDEETNINPPKGRILDLNEIRSELKGISKVKLATNADSVIEKDTTSSDESTSTTDVKYTVPDEEEEIDKKEKPVEKTAPTTTTTSSDDIYEFKEPEPFEFEARKIVDDKNKKRLVPRVIDDTDKSPKKKITKSPLKLEPKDVIPEEKKRFKRSPLKKLEETEIKEQQIKTIDVKPKVEDPFDKLIESPSFVHVNKSVEKPSDVKKAVRNLTDDTLPLFRPITEYTDVKLDISTEPSNEPYFSNKQQLFTDSNFANNPDVIEGGECLAFTKTEEAKKDSDDEDHIRASIQRVIAQSCLTDDDSSDGTSNQLEFSLTKNEISTQKDEPEQKEKEIKSKFEKEKEVKENVVLSKQMSTVFQGTDTNLLDQICSTSSSTKIDEVKDINVKSGTKIADSILQRFNLIKNKSETEVKTKEDQSLPPVKVQEPKEDEHTPASVDFKSNLSDDEVEFNKSKIEVDVLPEKFSTTIEVITETVPEKKRNQKKIVSKEFIDSDTDSDSEERLIIHSDDDSQTDTFDDNKPSVNESTENCTVEIKVEDERNFKIEDIKKSTLPVKEEVVEIESVKEEEPDSHIHSLLCQETIPGSPAPLVTEPKPKVKSIAEMPFASAPSSSNKSLLNNEISKPVKIERNPPSPVIVHQVELKRGDNRETSTVLDNTPPTTPESTISNLSPRG